jgi:uncharacterized membrane protein YbhN (UPF0104 family)
VATKGNILKSRNAKRTTSLKACVGMVIGLLAAVALFFITLAAFIWAEDQYGEVIAGLGLGVIFLAFAAAVFMVVWLRRCTRSRRGREARMGLQQAPPSGHDSVAMAAGIEVLRLIGARGIFPALVLSAVILAVLEAAPRTKRAEQQK